MHRRPGFTLVELLMVITIIGMLVALVSVAAMRAIGTANNAKITIEIGLLDSAMQTYKNDSGGAFPPDGSVLTQSLSNNTTTPQAQDVTNRQNRILAHLRKAFPRLIVPGGYGPASTQGTLQYMSQKAFSASTLYGSGGSGIFSGTAPNGTSTWGDFDNLDPAEAMVFWLGGFAIPFKDGTGKLTYKLIGFSANKVGNANSAGPLANGPSSGFGPFNLDVTSRDAGPFEFSQGRLGDADGDGWPEYYPPIGDVPQPPGSTLSVANPTPPYVYFDAISYTSVPPVGVYPQSAVYPSPLAVATGASASAVPGDQPSAALAPGLLSWGVATPYVQTIPASGAMTWVNPTKFQIICAGLDQSYWLDPTGFLVNNNLRPYPAGTNYSQGDLDNLSNFTSSTLQSAQP